MDCQQCKEPLLTLEQDSVEIDYCIRCRGVWLDAGELNLLPGGGEAGFIQSCLMGKAGRGDRTVKAGRPCPVCGRKTEKGKVDIAGVIRTDHTSPGRVPGEEAPWLSAERCPACLGLWLDGGSLEKLINLKNGGTIQPFLDWLQKIFNHQPARDGG